MIIQTSIMNLSKSSTCSAEFGSKVFAVFNVILTAMASLTTICAIIFCTAKALFDYKSNSFTDGYEILSLFLIGGAIVILMVFSFVAFMFAIFLVNGIYKKKPEHMHAYYVYGVAVEIMSVLATVGYSLLAGIDDMVTPVATLAICFCYGLILSMIKMTYIEFQILNQQYNHQPLTEKC